MPTAKQTNPRLIAAKHIHRVLINKGSLDQSLQHDCSELSTRDAALAMELSYGTLRHFPTLSGCVDQLLKKPMRQKDLDIYTLLLMGCYQLHFLRVPDHAAVSSTVALCAKLKKVWAKQLVNGVLRQFQQRHETLLSSLEWWQREAHPQWLAQQLKTDWPVQYEAILAADNLRPPMFLRINQQRISASDYLALLQAKNIEASTCEFSRCGLLLSQPHDVKELPGFEDGLFSVQDEAAQLAAGLMDLQAGQRILDVCAAPGGKTGHLLEVEPDLEVLALDIDEIRQQRTIENLQRLKHQAQVLTADACELQTWWNRQPFDRILLDAPCSAVGVIRRHPDIKLLRQPNDVAQLLQRQKLLLERIWTTLKPGGLLLYATCSLLRNENEYQVQQFIDATPDAIEQKIAAQWGIETGVGRQLFPQDGGHDGFYYACLKKTTITE